MRRRMLATTIAAALFGVVAARPGVAAAMKSTPETPASGMVIVKVINWRNADPVDLQAAASGSSNWTKVLGALKAGQWTWAKVPQGSNCRVDLRGKYADGQSADASNLEVCADKAINLTN
jgi:hypothetical protein